MTTKEQERKALAQIEKIIKGLGEDSYIGKAFEGCFEIAEDNINNDFWNSMKDQRDTCYKGERAAREKAQELRVKVKALEKRAEDAENQYNTTQQSSDRWVAKYHEAKDMATENWNKFREQEDKVEALEQEIIRLKARLFDMMEAQGA